MNPTSTKSDSTMPQFITLNVPYDLSGEDWAKVAAVYETLDGWIGNWDAPSWYGAPGDTQYICVSSEPSGLLVEGNVDSALWTGWLTVLCARLSLALGREIHDAEVERVVVF